MPPDSFNVAVLLGGIGVVVSGTQACLRTMLFPRKPKSRGDGVEGPGRQYMMKSKLAPIQEEIWTQGRAVVPPLSRHLSDD